MKTERLLTAIANTMILCLALGVIGVSLYATWSSPQSTCLVVYQAPLMAIGGVIFIGALVGLLALVCDNSCLVCMQLTVTFAGMWALLAFVIFALVVAGPGGTSLEKSRGFTVFMPSQFSAWMQAQVASNDSWSPLSACLASAHTCGDVRSYLGNNLKKQQLSPLEAGCCLPPEGCIYGGVNMSAPTFYSFAFDLPTMPKLTLPDASVPPQARRGSRNCSAFSPEPDALCYGCEYCQGGLLSLLRDTLRLEAYVSLGIFVAIFMLLLIACFAYCGARGDDDEESGKVKKTEISLARQQTFVIADPMAPQLLPVPTFKRTLTMGDGGPAFSRTMTMNDGGGGGGGGGAAATNAQLTRTLTRIEQALGADLQAFKRSNTMVGGEEGERREFNRTRTFQTSAKGAGDGDSETSRSKTWSRNDSNGRNGDGQKGRLLGRVDTLESSGGPEHGKFRTNTFKRGEEEASDKHSQGVGKGGRGRHREYDEESGMDSDDMSEEEEEYYEDEDEEDDGDLYD